jgi:hypothetical protein
MRKFAVILFVVMITGFTGLRVEAGRRNCCCRPTNCCSQSRSCCQPATTCCAPEPTCCSPAPTCCTPAPATAPAAAPASRPYEEAPAAAPKPATSAVEASPGPGRSEIAAAVAADQADSPSPQADLPVTAELNAGSAVIPPRVDEALPPELPKPATEPAREAALLEPRPEPVLLPEEEG